MSAQPEAGTAVSHRVLIVGAGYAGMATAVQLAARVSGRDDVQVTLVNAQERFTERLRLHLAATGQRLAELSIPRMLEGTGARFVRGWVTAVDAGARTVRVDDDRVLRYDTLVYGLGGVADTVAVPGAEDHAYALTHPRHRGRCRGRGPGQLDQVVGRRPFPGGRPQSLPGADRVEHGPGTAALHPEQA